MVTAKLHRIVLKGGVLCLLLVVQLFALSGCQSDLSIAEDRTQSQALRIVALLNNQGIAAYASKNRNGGRFSVVVPSRYYHQGVSLVNEYELADDALPTVEELVEPRGFLPGSRETERFRLDLALGLQLEESLENIAGVVSAEVLIRKHGVKDPDKAGGSVTLLVKPGADVAQDRVVSLVKAALPDIDEENIIVEQTIFEADNQPRVVKGVSRSGGSILTVPLRKFFFWQVPEGDHSGLALAFLASVGISAVLFAVLGYLIGYVRSIRSTVADASAAGTETDMLGFTTERGNKHLPEN